MRPFGILSVHRTKMFHVKHFGPIGGFLILVPDPSAERSCHAGDERSNQHREREEHRQTCDLLSRRNSRLPQFLLGIVELVSDRVHTLLGFCWAKTRSRGNYLRQICRIRRPATPRLRSPETTPGIREPYHEKIFRVHVTGPIWSAVVQPKSLRDPTKSTAQPPAKSTPKRRRSQQTRPHHTMARR
jgi:hypothetical protein